MHSVLNATGIEMNKIRIKNLRSLGDTGEISLKGINILVGNNSSGKSTFLRVFPLFKQSFNRKINGPILWSGDDDDYVDFGDFSDSINYNAGDQFISFAFSFAINLDENNPFSLGYNSLQKAEAEEVEVEFCIRNNKKAGYDYISFMELNYRKNKARLNFSERNMLVDIELNNRKVAVKKNQKMTNPFIFENTFFDGSIIRVRYEALDRLRELFNCKEKESYDDINEIITYIYTKYMLETGTHKKTKIRNIEKYEELFTCNREEIETWIKIFSLSAYFFSVFGYLKSFFSNVYYIAPVRATAQRYYGLTMQCC